MDILAIVGTSLIAMFSFAVVATRKPVQVRVAAGRQTAGR